MTDIFLQLQFSENVRTVVFYIRHTIVSECDLNMSVKGQIFFYIKGIISLGSIASLKKNNFFDQAELELEQELVNFLRFPSLDIKTYKSELIRIACKMQDIFALFRDYIPTNTLPKLRGK